MTGTMHSPIPFAMGGPSGRTELRTGVLDGAAERAGRALLRWAERRRTTEPRIVDLTRVPRGGALGRPFC